MKIKAPHTKLKSPHKKLKATHTVKSTTDKVNSTTYKVKSTTNKECTSNLNGKTYYTRSFEPLDCSTKNVIYGIECTRCGLLYVGETRQTLRSRMKF
jgi:hypothetical protein